MHGALPAVCLNPMNAQPSEPGRNRKSSADAKRRRAAEGGKALRHSIKQALKKAILPGREDAGKCARGKRLGS